MTIYASEKLLPDDYPIYVGYYYLVDGEVKISNIHSTVGELKSVALAKEIRSCSLVDRNIDPYGE